MPPCLGREDAACAYYDDLIAALAPKTSAGQKGTLYEGHDYTAIGAACDAALLMTYEWGYTYGPPMAVAPIRNVRQVVEYALTEIPPEKIWLGVPTYGYDWTLPYEKGQPGHLAVRSPRPGAGSILPSCDPLRRDGPGPLVPLHR